MHHTSTCILVNHKLFYFLNIWEFAEKSMTSDIEVFTYGINGLIAPLFSCK